MVILMKQTQKQQYNILFILFKYAVLFVFGGTLYMSIELLWRSKTSISMGIVAGIAFISIGLLNEILNWNDSFWLQCLCGCLLITVLELISGTILNIWLGLNIWDYSDRWGNYCGQICPLFSFFWFLLSGVAIILDDGLRHLLFNEEIKKYKLF